ncbi:MAG TPA: hypothetical protein VMF06_06835 [Candidatus Limnocylindria bacterium]|jgi:tetratricopeptide (TPR) repeat protein|nr:hypothetical protein [Candidatus Limnocylindria bacterium]
MKSADSGESKEPPGELREDTGIEDLHLPHEAWRVRAIIGVILLILAFVVGWIGYPHLRHWQGRRLARFAEHYLVQNDFAAALTTLRAATRKAPADQEVLRASAHYSSKAGLPDAIDYWERLLATGRATQEDKIETAGAALGVDRVDFAMGLLIDILQRQPTNRDALRLSVKGYASLQDRAGAIATARKLLAIDPQSESDQVLLGQLLLSSLDPASQAEGKSLLWDIAMSNSTLSTDAMGFLARSPQLNRVEDQLLLRRVQAAANGQIKIQLIEADLMLHINPSDIKGPVRRVLDRFDTAGQGKTEIALWAQQRAPALLAAFLDDERVSTNKAFVAIKAESLADSNQWQPLTAFIDKSSSTMDPVEVEWLKARIVAGHGKLEDARKQLQVAIEWPTATPRALILLAGTAESLGFLPEAIQAWEKVSKTPILKLRGNYEALRLARSIPDLTAVRRIVTRLCENRPGEPELAGERSVLDALFGENISRATEILAKLHREQPGNATWRDGLALALLRANDVNGALALYDDKNLTWAATETRGLAIYVAVLGVAGQREAARHFARRVQMDRLQPVEKKLVEPWL